MTDPLEPTPIIAREKRTSIFKRLQQEVTRFLHVNMDSRHQRNGYYLVIEMLWATFLNAATTFNAAYIIRLGASDQEVSFLTSLPALISIIVSIPAAKVLQRSRRRKNLIMGSLTLHRFGYLAIALLPWLKGLGLPQSSMAVATLILFTLPLQVFNIGFIGIQATAITVEQRPAVFAMRNQVFHAVRSVTVFLLGLWLDSILFPLNYQIMYLVTFVLSLISILYLMKIESDDQQSEAQPAGVQPGKVSLWQRLKNTLREFRENEPFLKFSINTFLMDFGLWGVMPLFSIYYVNTLNASDSWLGLTGSTSSVANIIGFGLWAKLIPRYGRKKTLKITALMRPIFPLVVAISQNLTAIAIGQVVVGFLMPGLGLSHTNLLLSVTPADKRDDYTAMYTTLQNVNAFLAPVLGTYISSWIGLPATILIFAGIRFLGGLMWTINPIPDPEPSTSPT